MRFAIFYSVIVLVVIWRYLIPLKIGRGAKIFAGLLMWVPLLMQFWLLSKGGLASPAVPRWALITFNVLSLTLVFVAILVIVREVFIFVSVLAGRSGERAHQVIQKDKRVALGMLAVTGGLASFGVSQGISVARVVKRDMPIANLPDALEGFTIVQLSDLHASALLREPHMMAVMERVNALNPDLILITGDVADGFVTRREKDVAPLAQLKAKLGVFVCEGNHEHYVDYDHWVQEFPRMGWHFLRNASETVTYNGAQLTIGGVTDPMAKRFGREMPDAKKAFENAPEVGPRILMAHQPKPTPEYRKEARFDVVLSGHTHGGQIRGMDRGVAFLNGGFVYGWYPLEGGSKLYVHSGTGLWNGFAIRLGVPSEIVLFTLKKA